MSTPTIPSFPTLSFAARCISVAIGLLVFAVAVVLYFRPPNRVSGSETTVYPSNDRTTSQSTSASEPSTVVVAMLTAGVFFIVFGLNGIRVTKLSSLAVSLETPPVTGYVPEEPQNPPGVHISQQLNSPSQPMDAALRTFEVLLTPSLPTDFQPDTIPGPAFPPGLREMKPGQKITCDPRGLTNPTSIFFFSHDIMLCFSALLCNAPRKVMFYTARQAKNHLSEIGFAATPLVSQLDQIMAECDPNNKTEITESRRYEIAAEIFRLSRIVGAIIEQTAPKLRLG